MSGQVPNIDTSKIVSKHKKELDNFLDKYCNPAFGSLTKKEIDLLVFEMMINLGELTKDMYENQVKLKITSSKIKNMYYESELRKKSYYDLDKDLKNILEEPIILKHEKVFKVQIDNPLLMDHFKAKMKKLKHLTDSSFSKEIITITDKAYYDLIVEMIPQEQQKKYEEELEKAGAKSKSKFRLAKQASVKFLSRYFGEYGEEILELGEEEFKSFISGLFNNVTIKSLMEKYNQIAN